MRKYHPNRALSWLRHAAASSDDTTPPPQAPPPNAAVTVLSGEEINARLQRQLQKLREKDRQAKALSKEDLKIVYQDDHLLVVDKPAGVLSVPSEAGIPSLAQTVYDAFGRPDFTMDQMVVHRLGMDTSGLVVFARTMDALRGMNTLFRTRKVTRQYEALVCGHVVVVSTSNNNKEQEHGWIRLPLMRDYEHPPFMRVSTLEHQRALIGLDPTVVGRKLLEAPKACLTKYTVVSREYLNNNNNKDTEEDATTSSSSLRRLPVTRLTLTSISGRTHQLNVHCAAMGHAIVGDSVYGIHGDAAPFGGLDSSAIGVGDGSSSAASAVVELQQAIYEAWNNKNNSSSPRMCIHAKHLAFRHPVTREQVTFDSPPPF